jgi:WD40 repeat protein
VGTEDGNVLNGVLQGSMSMEKDEIAACLMAPITSVQNHPNSECGLLLVGSVDWTVKLYQKGGQKQLMTIDAYDEYVYDVKWSPTNPCIFASADGGGNLDVWDLGKSLETPYTKQVTSSRALNKLAWDNNGYRIAAGNSASAIYVYQMDKEYSHNKNDDWIKALLGHLQIPESS